MEITLPIEHLSYSAMRSYCANQQQFFKNYILGIWDYKSSFVALVGQAFHKTMENYYRTQNIDDALKVGVGYINQIKDNDVEWGKTGTREQAIKELSQVVNFYLNEEPDLGETIAIEEKITTDKGFNGEILPLPVKAVTDRVTKTADGKIHIVDYKVVSSFSDPEEEDPLKIIQAMFNFITISAKFGQEPEDIIYLEVKKTQNRDHSPQVNPYRIKFAEQEEYKTYFTKIYTDVIVELAREDRRYLPNFGDMYNGKEAWKDYVSEVINFKELPKVSHRTNLQIREIEYTPSDIETDETLSKEQKISKKLQEFGVSVEMKETFVGHNVILYTMIPARGVRMASFEKHGNDIKLALEAKSVRIQAPIPGTGLVGIEVNKDSQEILEWSDELVEKDSLNIPLGQDVYGQKHSVSLDQAPHILIGGTTGSGKSVFLNTIIKALSSQMEPEDLHMILIDPKRTEFVEHENLPHLEVGVITESEQVESALRWAVGEMEDRYKKLREARVKDIKEYRKRNRDIPYLVIVIDELSDLMLSGDWRKSIEESIIRLAQKARAVGIHIVAATQRPSVDVIPGIMKANFPTQIAFMVNKKIDSQVIIDQPGAEELLGKGDMLIASPGIQGIQRLQAYYTK
jgi:DNA segregation ATPase FtsK/SpoIIIE-like protein